MKRPYNKFLPLAGDPNLENSPFHWISQVHTQYIQNIDYALKIYGLDNSRRQILLALKSKNNASVSDLSKIMICKISTTTKIVHRLKNEGLVETSTCKIDGRFTRVTLTKKGDYAIQNINTLNHIIITQSFDGLTPLQIENFLETLKYIFKRLSN
ncbi:MarR family winged helix-turn-helix transcriptional regulator [Acinetobacter sp. I-MWF]|uniref:MarR family winged helix-turn-helix transcriptional regulator n=1 Tax=Acinetobacter sp. I-MWF TaxID=2940517 RepID=UPI0021C7F661|nr:MarR family winged helix-turn-helix transcriptional regulator [Acinetobacter sp. I-MWF]MCT9979433.1 MarR family winged helix-turn-helix transcriptional regulator [Acinetobacter sp. I-MWF]